MAENLNLLPQNLQMSKGVSSALKTIKALGVISIVVFIIFSIGMGAFFVYSKVTLDNLKTNVDRLKSQIKAQESSEQQLVLLKDRLSKIASIKSTPSASKNIAGLSSLLENVSQASSMNTANISSSKIDISMVIRSNEDLVTFLSNLKNTKLFTSANLGSLSYGAGSGYSVVATLSNK